MKLDQDLILMLDAWSLCAAAVGFVLFCFLPIIF